MAAGNLIYHLLNLQQLQFNFDIMVADINVALAKLFV